MKEEERTRRSRKYWVYILGVLIGIGVLIGTVYYIHYVRNSLMLQTISNVLTVTKQQQVAFGSFIERDRERIHSYAVNFSERNSTDIEYIQSTLNVFAGVDALYSVVNLETGEYYTSESDDVFLMDEEERAVFSSFSGSSVREPYTSIHSNTKRFGYYECFTFADGVKALVQKGYESDRVSEEFTLSFYNDQGFAYVINSEGDVLLRPSVDTSDKYYVKDNIFDMFYDTEIEIEQSEALKRALEARETGTVILNNVDGDFVYSYVPIENVEGWYLVSIVPEGEIMDEANQLISNSQIVIMIAIAVLTVFTVAVTFMWQAHRELEQKEQEKEYREQQFSILANYLASNTDDAYLMLKEDRSSIEYASPNFERVLGIPVDDALKDLKILHDENIRLEDLKENEASAAVELERVNPGDGGRRWFSETVYCAYIQNEKKYIIYISDRTKEWEVQNNLQTALDAAKVASQAKSSFLSSVSHDIRTPMNAIIGLVTLLEQEADNPESVREYAKRIDVSSQHLLGLINDVLDMNKIESGKAMLNAEEMHLAEVIEGLNSIIRPQARAKNQTMEIYTSGFKYEHLIGDKMRINQILINILSNAVKYTQKGGRIEVTVSELPQVLEGFSRIQFKVKDNGQGMSEEYQRIIFDPFTREQNTKTNKIQGTGLGMAITRNLVELMGGTISVESKLGEGSTFTVEIDLRIQEKEDGKEFWEEHGVRRIIIADDDREICENVVRSMEKTGVIVDYVTNGADVINTMRKAREGGKPYDLLLLDWQMPEVSGLEVAKLIRKNYSEKLPILLFTAYDWAEIEKEALMVGIDHFIPKPFFLSRFKEAIKRLMYKKSPNGMVPMKSDESAVKGKHILMVEDIEVNRLVLGKILQSRGSTFDIAENGQEAVDKFERSAPGMYDIILMDVQMPVMDGYQATRAIRAGKHPDAKTVPIIAMTANAFADDVMEALDSGMDAHVAKPIILDQLEKTIRVVLERNEAERNSQK